MMMIQTFNIGVKIVLDFGEDEEDLVLCGLGVVRDLAG